MPELKFNLLSVSQVCSKQLSVLFNDKEAIFLKPGFVIPPESVLLRTPKVNGTYKLNMNCNILKQNNMALLSKATDAESKLWHQRLGHVYFKNINKLVQRNLVRGLPHKRFECAEKCISCTRGKQHRVSHKAKSVNSISSPYDLLHMDLFGPVSIKSLGRNPIVW